MFSRTSSTGFFIQIVQVATSASPTCTQGFPIASTPIELSDCLILPWNSVPCFCLLCDVFARKRTLVSAVRNPFKDWINLSDVQELSFIMQKGLQVTLIVSARISTIWILYLYGIKDSPTYEDIKTILLYRERLCMYMYPQVTVRVIVQY